MIRRRFRNLHQLPWMFCFWVHDRERILSEISRIIFEKSILTTSRIHARTLLCKNREVIFLLLLSGSAQVITRKWPPVDTTNTGRECSTICFRDVIKLLLWIMDEISTSVKAFKRGCQHPSNKFEILWQVAQNSFSHLLSYFVAQYVLIIVM